MQHESAGDRIRVVVRVSSRVQYVEGKAQDPYRLFFDLQGAAPVAGLATKVVVGDPVLQSIRIAQHQPDVTRVVLDLGQQAPHTVSFLPDPPQLIIEIVRQAPMSGAIKPPTSAPAKTTPAETHHAASLEKAATPPTVQPRKPRPLPSVATSPEVSKPTPPAPPVTATQPTPAAPVSQPQRAAIAPQEGRLAERFDVGAPSNGTLASQLLPAAQRGDARAQFQLGDLYMAGHGGVTRDPRLAANWYLQAAQQGHALASANLGVLYANGWGVQKSDADAVAWFRKAAEAGDPGGQNNLGAMYITGRGVQQDDTLGAKWVLAAAEQGIPEAQYTMGTLYANGRGVPHDDAQAVNWLHKAAVQGYATAQVALGKLYVTGSGVLRDYRQALKLFQSANVPEAWYQMALLYKQGLGVTASDSEAMVWLLKAAEGGYPEAQYAIGRFYTDRYPVEAYSWFALAAASGHKDAVAAMNALVPRLTQDQLTQAQKRALDLAHRVSN